MILRVCYHPVISATRNRQLSHKRGITFRVVNDYVDKRGLGSHTLRHVTSSFRAAEMSRGSREEKTKNGRGPNTQVARGPRDGPEEKGGGRRRAGGSSVEPPAAVSRSHTRGARQQTQFTKRHLFHYSNALWLITSWPVCEMTATYSPVNRKICTCSIWGVGEPRSGGWGGR